MTWIRKVEGQSHARRAVSRTLWLSTTTMAVLGDTGRVLRRTVFFVVRRAYRANTLPERSSRARAASPSPRLSGTWVWPRTATLFALDEPGVCGTLDADAVPAVMSLRYTQDAVSTVSASRSTNTRRAWSPTPRVQGAG